MMVPMPWAASASLNIYKARLQAAFEGANVRVLIAFWLFGLINNIFYVIILSAALDLVGPLIPKATVLLSSIIPSLAVKLTVPYFLDRIPYSLRIIIFVVLSTCGMLIVALSPDRDAQSVAAKLTGIVLANVSAGAGEVNFLSLTHFYGPFSLAAWGSGTGAAGLVGAMAYAIATTTLGFSPKATLLASAIVPIVMLVSYFMVLPLAPLRVKQMRPRGSAGEANGNEESEIASEREGLLAQPDAAELSSHSVLDGVVQDLKLKLQRAQRLVVPYMGPLFLVFAAEYTINQGVAPTLLFPLAESPFHQYRAFYPAYGAIYQLGVFVSRSSLPFVRIKALYVPSILQVLNLVLLSFQALWSFIPTVWIIFVIIFWEGLLGGLVYVSAFADIREEVPEDDREFSLGAAAVADATGIFLAGFLGVAMESSLCRWQVQHGRDWCQKL